MDTGRHIGFDLTGNGAVRSAVPKNHTLEPNMKSDGALQSYGHSKFFTLWLDIGHRRPDTPGDFIFCPMLLCSALDRQ